MARWARQAGASTSIWLAPIADGRVAQSLCCLHSEELLAAAQEGDTATVLALLARDVDVDSKAYDGYGSRGCILALLIGQNAGRAVRPLGVELQDCLCGCAGRRRCSLRWIMATRRRRWRSSRRAQTCTARTPAGTVFGAASSCGCVAHKARRTVRPLGLELQEFFVWLCRSTALHYASLDGHTETAMALVKAGADVHYKDDTGYGSRAASSCGRFVSVGADGQCTRDGAA